MASKLRKHLNATGPKYVKHGEYERVFLAAYV